MEHKNIFVSHYHKDEEWIDKLKELLEPRGYELRNSSVESSKEENSNLSDKEIETTHTEVINCAGVII